MDENSVKIILRKFNADTDSACIFATWRNAAYYGSGGARESSGMFFKKLTKRIKDTLPEATIRIACLEDHRDTIIGWSISTGNHLDFIYVKIEYRLKGIGTMLFPKTTETVSDRLTKIGQIIVEKKKLKTKGESSGSSRDERAKEKERAEKGAAIFNSAISPEGNSGPH